MILKVEFNENELLKIAKEVHDNLPSRSGMFTISIKFDNIEVDITIDYYVEYIDCIGGSYENYDLERFSEIENEFYTVEDIIFYDSSGVELPIKFNMKQIDDVL